VHSRSGDPTVRPPETGGRSVGKYRGRGRSRGSDDPLHLRVRASTVEPMADVGARSSIDESLHLALDLSLALGCGRRRPDRHGAERRLRRDAFGWCRVPRRAARLQLLSHTGAHGRELFWNAEVIAGPDVMDRSVACAVVPMWAGATQVGLLGIVDTWLPERDGEPRDGFCALAIRGLGQHREGRRVPRRPPGPGGSCNAPPQARSDLAPAHRVVTLRQRGRW